MHNKRGKSKKAIQLSFTFIFSLIIIAVVIFVAIWAIKNFLELKDRTTIQVAIKDVETIVQEVWQSTEAIRTENLYFPKPVDYLCFVNKSNMENLNEGRRNELNKYGQSILNKYNLFILPYKVKIKYGIAGYYSIKCGNVECLKLPSSICFKNKNGKVKIRFMARDNKVYVVRP